MGSNSLIYVDCFHFSTLDENGCIVRPPSVTIVLLTMHKWFVTSQELFTKVLEMYPFDILVY